MNAAQLDRLKRDRKELDHYIHKLNKKGRIDLAHKVNKKRDFLNQHILELNQQ